MTKTKTTRPQILLVGTRYTIVRLQDEMFVKYVPKFLRV